MDILCILYAPLERFPPSLNQVFLLAKEGFSVGVIDQYHPNVKEYPFEKLEVTRIRPCRYNDQQREPLDSFPRRVHKYLRFKATVKSVIREAEPKVVICYDTLAFLLGGRIWRKRGKEVFSIWHFHETPSAGERSVTGKIIQYAERFCLANAKKVDLIVFPDKNRAAFFRKLTDVKVPILIVNNCPLKLEKLPEKGLMKKRLSQFPNYRGEPLIYFQGSINPSRGIESIIKSMPYWEKNAFLILVGGVEDSYKEKLLLIASEVGVSDRVLFLGYVQYTSLPSLAVDADVGICMVLPGNNPNWIYSAGAINKRFEYMSYGLPIVTNTGPGIQELVVEPNCGLAMDPEDIPALTEAVNQLLGNKADISALKARARDMHLTKYNYQDQFAPVMKQIKEHLFETHNERD